MYHWYHKHGQKLQAPINTARLRFHWTALPPKVVPKTVSSTWYITTLSGKIQTQGFVTLRDLLIKTGILVNKSVLSLTIKNDIILGTNFLSKAGIKPDYSAGKMEWFNCSIPFCPPGGLTSTDFDTIKDMFFIQTEDEILGGDWLCH